MFQFLIGSLKLIDIFYLYQIYTMFQFLIGSLKLSITDIEK